MNQIVPLGDLISIKSVNARHIGTALLYEVDQCVATLRKGEPDARIVDSLELQR